VHGYLKVESFSGENDHFYRLKEVVLKKNKKEKSFRVESVTEKGERLLLKLDGIDTREEAKLYANYEVWVPRSQASTLEQDEYYAADIVGCNLYYSGREVGKIISICEGPQADLLEVGTADGRTRMVPFIDEYVGIVDTDRKTIELRTGWILE